MIGFIVNVILTGAVLYNIHHSFRGVSKSDRKFYKHYFIVISFLLVVDNVFSFVPYKIPHYQIFKLCLLGWLSVPKGTGPHFIYNVYIKNIHSLFEGDIDSVIASFKGYFEQLKAKYTEMVNTSKKGEIRLSFGDSKEAPVKHSQFESSDVDMDASAISGDDDKDIKQEVKEEIPTN